MLRIAWICRMTILPQLKLPSHLPHCNRLLYALNEMGQEQE